VRGCAIFTTDFTEDPPGLGTDLGDNWAELFGGDFTIEDSDAPPAVDPDLLQEAGNAGAIAQCLVKHPKRKKTGYLEVGIVGMTVGDARSSVLINCTSGATAYIYVSWERPANNQWKVTIGSTTDGDLATFTNDAGDPDTGDSKQVFICWGPLGRDDKILVTVGTIAGSGTAGVNCFACCTANPLGYYIGLKNELATPVYWDLVSWTEHHASNSGGGCPHCLCTCDGYCIPQEVTATIVNVSGCATLDGTTIQLTAGGEDIDSEDQGLNVVWSHDSPHECGEHDLTLAMECCVESAGGGPVDCTDTGGVIEPESFRMTLGNADPCVSSPGSDYASAIPESTCSPLGLVFGPFTIASDNECDCCDGTVMIVVTE
jgi:hypothetical protein